jgi:putative FmdB family regulatory protein
MPLYDYACPDCSHTFEALVRNGESVECPHCKGARPERQLSLPARPHTESKPLPMGGCRSEGPPCGPACNRWQG